MERGAALMVLELAATLGILTNLLGVAGALRRLLLMAPSMTAVEGTIAAILPLTGRAPQLDELVRRLDEQTVAISELLISVESTDDPAFARAREAAAAAKKVPIRVVVAGLASDEGQKCRNQQAGLEQISPSADFIVLLDADIKPSRHWLQMLLSPLAIGGYDIVTGHRWHRVARPRLGAHLAAAIDRSMTLLPRLDFVTQVTWGGSFAMTPATARALDLSGCLRGRLSDDLSVGIRASERGLRIATRSALLIDSPVDHDVVSAWRFGRRQYQIGKVYRPDLWFMALGGLGLRALGFGAAVALTVWHQNPWPLAALMALGLSKQALVCAVGARAGLPDPACVLAVQYLLGLLQPLVDLFHLSIVVAAGWTRRIGWGHVTYEVAGPDHVRVIGRRPFSS